MIANRALLTMLAGGLLCAGVAACSANGAKVLPAGPTAGSTASVAARGMTSAVAIALPDRLPKELIYVSDENANSISVFDRKGNVLGTITSGLNYPQGLYVDADHNLWVANESGSNIVKFKRGASKPSETLDDPGAGPSGLTICPDGTIYVANIVGGNVAVYENGSRNPTRTLNYGGPFFYVTCDKRGNVFATAVAGTNGGVIEFPKGQQANSKLLPIFMGGNPGGIVVNNAGNLLVGDESAGTVTEYDEAGSPTGFQIATGFGVTGLDLDRGGKNIGVGLFDYSGPSFGQDFGFPSGKAKRMFSNNISFAKGFAFDPPQKWAGK